VPPKPLRKCKLSHHLKRALFANSPGVPEERRALRARHNCSYSAVAGFFCVRCGLRISSIRKRSVSSARRWIEAFRLSIN